VILPFIVATPIEADIRAGRSGRKEFDGGYLCPKCMSFVFLEELEPILKKDLGCEQQKANRSFFFPKEG